MKYKALVLISALLIFAGVHSYQERPTLAPEKDIQISSDEGKLEKEILNYFTNKYPADMVIKDIRDRSSRLICTGYLKSNPDITFEVEASIDPKTKEFSFTDTLLQSYWNNEIENKLYGQIAVLGSKVHSISCDIAGVPYVNGNEMDYSFTYPDYSPQSPLPSYFSITDSNYINKLYKELRIQIDDSEILLDKDRKIDQVFEILQATRSYEFDVLAIDYGIVQKDGYYEDFICHFDDNILLKKSDINKIDSAEDIKFRGE